MKIISFFNHKGGVAKTTTVFHLGWKLAQMGKKVLLVDTDSQCNLSMISLGSQGFLSLMQNDPSNNIKSGLDGLFSGNSTAINVPNCVQIQGNANLFLLPGNFELSSLDVSLSVAMQMVPLFASMNNLPGALYALIEQCSQQLNIDYVLIDLNPSLSTLNQIIISSSDYFVIPTSPDNFSRMAISSIARILPKWETTARSARTYFAHATYPLPLKSPKLLGYTVNDYNIRNGNPTEAFNNIIDDISQDINGPLKSALASMTMLPITQYDLCLAKVSNFQHLQPKYQEYSTPVFALTDDQIGTQGIILTNHQQKRTLFDDIYNDFADKVITNAI